MVETTRSSVIRYREPRHWIRYDPRSIMEPLTNAKAAVMALQAIPYQRNWADDLQRIQLKREIAGTSRIEGADFTDRELDEALGDSPEALVTRSQRQAAAASRTYMWISELEDDTPITEKLISEIHRRIIHGADDDHCEPGQIRTNGNNVIFGTPRHRGAEGGEECAQALAKLVNAVTKEYRAHDTLVQALAFHYHFAAMHPFGDGNGRTARALEALMLRKAGLRDVLFIAMSNYYYDEKSKYLATMASVRASDSDLTEFLVFGLQGIERQCERLAGEIKKNLRKALFENVMYDMFKRLESTRTRVMTERQINILKMLLDVDRMEISNLFDRTHPYYSQLKHPVSAWKRDLLGLLNLKAVGFERAEGGVYYLFARLEWPTEITEAEFFERLKDLPTAKTYPFL